MKATAEAQMRYNAEQWLRECGFPPTEVIEEPPLMTRSDHCFLRCTPGVVAHARATMCRWNYGIGWKDHQPLGYPTAYGGWRERGLVPGEYQWRWAAQLIYHQDSIRGKEFLELDFDSFNPDGGLTPLIGHAAWDWLVQKVFRRKTNPFTVAKKRGWEEVKS